MCPFSSFITDYELVNEVRDGPYRPKPANDPHPYAVRVPAPAKIAAAHIHTKITAAHLPTKFTTIHVPPKTTAASTSSHPYAVRVPAPRVSPPDAPGPVGIKPSADFEPMMTESRTSTSLVQRILPPQRGSSTPRLLRSRRASQVFPEEEMQTLLSHVLRK